MQRQKSVIRLTESALMLAFATVLSFLKLIDLPYGGSVTAASMLPLILIAYRYGTAWGLFVGLTHGVLQLFLGIKNVMGVDVWSVIAILLLDYLIAFAVMGVGGFLRRFVRRQSDALTLGALLGCVLRYLCHVLSGCTVWAVYAPDTMPVLTYSAIYNATYMLPETIILTLAAYYIGSLLDFGGESITRLAPQRRTRKAAVLSGVGNTLLLLAAGFDVVAIFGRLQDPETGLFTVRLLQQAPWLWMLILTVVGVAGWLICRACAARASRT